jgi:tetratricopeptide (TPR) repeat protein
MKNANEKENVNERFNDFAQKNRTAIFIVLGVLALILVGFIGVFSISSAMRNKAIAEAEELAEKYNSLQPQNAEEAMSYEMESLLAEIKSFASSAPGYAGARAWALAAAVHGERKEWEEAEEAWAAAAASAKKTYLAPVAWYNAGGAAEEQGKTEEALKYYQKSVDIPADFPGAPQAQFSIGRLLEGEGDISGAIDAYRNVISGWSYDTVWKNLAHSRIIALESGAR